MRPALCAALIAVASPASVSWAAQCSVEEATNRVRIADVEHAARIAKNVLTLAAQEQDIVNALPKNSGNMPIGKLMNPDQAERFGHLRTQILAFNFDEMIESGLARDSEAVAIMYSAAKAKQENTEPPKSSNKAPLLLYSVLHSDPTMKPNVQVPQTRPNGCSVDDALAAELFDAQQRIDAFPSAILQASQATTDTIKAKYGSLDGTKMTPGDKEATQAALNAVAPALRTLEFEKDLQNLRDFWAVAQDVHNDRIMDVRENGADANSVGITEESEFSKRTSRDQMLFKAWGWLNKEMPSEKARQAVKTADEVELINKTLSSETKK